MLNTTENEELLKRCLAREAMNRIQKLRKDVNYFIFYYFKVVIFRLNY